MFGEILCSIGELRKDECFAVRGIEDVLDGDEFVIGLKTHLGEGVLDVFEDIEAEGDLGCIKGLEGLREGEIIKGE